MMVSSGDRTLPRTNHEAGAGAGEDVTAPREDGKVVVLVEDEPQIRELVERVLQRFGFAVVGVGNPEEAVPLVLGRATAVDLLLTDVLMPQMTGPVLVRTLRSHLPDLRVLYMSGFAGDSAARDLATDDAPLLRKPFTPSQLVAKVREALS